MEIKIWTAVVLIVVLFRFGHAADTNQVLGSSCSGSDNTTSVSEYQSSLNNVLNSLAANAPEHNGFYKTAAGKDANKIYGLTQCRADISATGCGSCIRNATTYRGCASSRKVTIWFTWCFIKYSDVSFFGVWDKEGVATANETDFEDPNVVSQGLNFMNQLASTAPKQPLMFQKAVLDVGKSGKRYGMAQCSLDISRSDCGSCLDAQLVTFRTTIGNKRGWDIYGSSCSLFYHDYQFYFNFSITANEGNERNLPHQVLKGMVVPVFVFLLTFF